MRDALLPLVLALLIAGCSAPAAVPTPPPQPIESVIPPSWDQDIDGIPDAWALAKGLRGGASGDEDADGVSNREEYAFGRPDAWDEARDGPWEGGLEPWLEDSDGDEMPDGWEIRFGLDPRERDEFNDTDDDGLHDRNEFACGGPPAWGETDPTDPDSDDDGLRDGEEVRCVQDRDARWAYDAIGNPRVADAVADFDADGLSNRLEALIDTDPRDPDTDRDGLLDGEEVWTRGLPEGEYVAISDPRLLDTDGDIVNDGDEVRFWLAHLSLPALAEMDLDAVEALSARVRAADADLDGFVDGDEIRSLSTDPGSNDTDGDGYTDWEEVVRCRTDPRVVQQGCDGRPIAEVDSDADGAPDSVEVMFWGDRTDADLDGDGQTALHDPDSDGDGVPDGLEIAQLALPFDSFYHTSPAIADTDGDGLDDGEEASNDLTTDRVGCRSSAAAPTGPAGFEPEDGCWYVTGAWGIRLYWK